MRESDERPAEMEDAALPSSDTDEVLSEELEAGSELAEPTAVAEGEDSLPVTDAESPAPTAPTEETIEEPSPDSELIRLREEVEQLRTTLAERQQMDERIRREAEEFRSLFPEVAVGEVPGEVWNTVEEGVPLSAAYALYEKKRQAEQARAEQVNRQNASRSAGLAGQNTVGEYFSADEVRAMSPRQVHDHYERIMESMRFWN